MVRVTRSPNALAVSAYVIVEEHEWLVSLLRDSANASPQFRMPDLIGACLSLVFEAQDPSSKIFEVLRSDLVLRGTSQRRQEQIWRADFERLQEIQRSAHNQYPHPNFSLDLILSACIAITRKSETAPGQLFQLARTNTAQRARSASDWQGGYGA